MTQPAAPTTSHQPRFRDVLTLRGKLQFLRWRLRGQRTTVQLATKLGFTAFMRNRDTSDFFNFYEIFVCGEYRAPFEIDPASIRHVLDLGGYVGYSLLHWLSRFPACDVTVYEPHPEHLKSIRRQLELNGWENRCHVYAGAAGASVGEMQLTDQGWGSTLTTQKTENTLTVPTRDLFADLAGRRFDLAKIDVEGGEYALIDDPRFADLRPRIICLEAHPDPKRGLDGSTLADKLRLLGYEVFMNGRLIWGRLA